MSRELKNCPKCNSEEVYEEGDEQHSCIDCIDCGYSLKRKDYEKCKIAWNKLKRKNGDKNEQV